MNAKTENQAAVLTVTGQETVSLSGSIEDLGRMVLQLGQLIGIMQSRLEDLEAKQAAVTVSHADVLRINSMIRMRAAELCSRYRLTDKASDTALRSAIKKDLKKRYGVKDLHDLQERQLAGAENAVAGWTNIRLIMDRRAEG